MFIIIFSLEPRRICLENKVNIMFVYVNTGKDEIMPFAICRDYFLDTNTATSIQPEGRNSYFIAVDHIEILRIIFRVFFTPGPKCQVNYKLQYK